MKKFLAAAAALALCGAGVAFAETSEHFAGNTVVVTGADGAPAHYHFDADQTFSVMSAAGAALGAGAWDITEGEICLTPTGGARACTEYLSDKNVGDTWEQAAVDGGRISVTLQAGRHHH